MELATLILEFLKALVWPVLTLFLALVFREAIRNLLSRITKGSLPGGVAFEARDAQRLAPEEQKQRRETEVKQAASSLAGDPKSARAMSTQQIAQDVELAETLVLKEIEAEYGGNLRRQVYLHGSTFDAVTWTSRGVTAVEVKLVGPRIDSRIFEALIAKAESIATKYHRNVFSFVVAAVTIDQPPEVRENIRQQIVRLKRDASVVVDVKVFDLSELRPRYGVTE